MNKENSKKSHANTSNSRFSVRQTIKNERPPSNTRKSLHVPQVTINNLSQNQRKSVSPNMNMKNEDLSTKSTCII